MLLRKHVTFFKDRVVIHVARSKTDTFDEGIARDELDTIWNYVQTMFATYEQTARSACVTPLHRWFFILCN
jgi:hypothetical protein